MWWSDGSLGLPRFLPVLLLLGLSLPPLAAVAEDLCDGVVVDVTMLPISGYLVSKSCMEEYGPWDEERLASCEGRLDWVTLEEWDLEEGVEYVLLCCEEASLFLVRKTEASEESISWGELKTLFR